MGPWACSGCGAAVSPAFLFCHRCGAVLWHPSFEYAEPPGVAAPVDRRTRLGLAVTALAAFLLWLPAVSVLGGILFSLGSYLLFKDRRRFGDAHRRGVNLAFLVLAVAAVVYVVAFGWYFWEGYEAYLAGRPLSALQGATELLNAVTAVPTSLLVTAAALQVRHLVPARATRHLTGAWVLLVMLVGLATLWAHLLLVGHLGSDPIRIATVFGVLNTISAVRMVEAPGFVWLAYVYYVAWAHRAATPAGSAGAGPVTRARGPASP